VLQRRKTSSAALKYKEERKKRKERKDTAANAKQAGRHSIG
jgi:hypothetical protein